MSYWRANAMGIRNLLEHEIPLAIELKVSCWPEELAGKAENTLKLKARLERRLTRANTP